MALMSPDTEVVFEEEATFTHVATASHKPNDFPPNQLSLRPGDLLRVVEERPNKWWLVQKGEAFFGVVPAGHLHPIGVEESSAVSRARQLSVETSVGADGRPRGSSRSGLPWNKNPLYSASPRKPDASANGAGPSAVPGDDTEHLRGAEEGQEMLRSKYSLKQVEEKVDYVGYLTYNVAGRLKFAAWSRHAVQYACAVTICTGLIAPVCRWVAPKEENDIEIISSGGRPENEPSLPQGGVLHSWAIAVLCAVLCLLGIVYERTYSVGVGWLRAGYYWVCSILALLTFETMPAAFCMFLVSLLATFSTLLAEDACKPRVEEEARKQQKEREQGKGWNTWLMVVGPKKWAQVTDGPYSVRQYMSNFSKEPLRAVWFWLRWRFLRLREKNHLGKDLLMVLYFGANLALFLEAFLRFGNKRDDIELWDFGPLAKGCGQLLNFNCALILAPVVRPLLQAFHWNLPFINRSLAQYVPLSKNIKFHRAIGWFVAVNVLIHIVGHYMTYAKHPQTYDAAFPINRAYITGTVITACIVLMYSAAQDDVKKRHFETFWFSHHLFAVFFVCLLLHGPNYWKWAVGPLVLYAADRLSRGAEYHRASLLRCRWEPPNVIKVVLGNAAQQAPKETGLRRMSMAALATSLNQGKQLMAYKEGQYLKLNCPELSKLEWHPFTISSPPESEELTVHIKCGMETSWTGQLKDLLMGMGTPVDGQEGREVAFGTAGEGLLRVDGPYAAPCQHIREYEVVLLTGAGIGLTPFASALQSILTKWAASAEQSETGPPVAAPAHTHFHWACRITEIEAYVWFLELLQSVHARYIELLGRGLEALLTVTVYITGPCTETQLAALSKAHDLHSPGQDVNPAIRMVLKKGRPNWESVFQDMRDRYKNHRIGVFHCGPMGKDLAYYCRQYSRITTRALHGEKEKTFFQCHAEVF